MSVEKADLVSRMREGRRSPATLKIALSHLRSTRPGSTVFVFEGVEDVGVYEVWISRCPVRPAYEPLPGKGKDQLLGLRQMLRVDTTGLQRAVYFFVDRDFDGLKGQSPGADIFIHETYSAENHLASEEVVESLLSDELRCAGDPEVRRAVLDRFSAVRAQFHALIRDINLRLFLARKCRIRLVNLEDSVSRFVSIELTEIRRLQGVSVSTFVVLEREPTDDEFRQHKGDFDAMIPLRDYRGKYELQLVQRWVTKLAEDRCAAQPQMFGEHAATANISTAITLRSFASRCCLPGGLVDFVAAAA